MGYQVSQAINQILPYLSLVIAYLLGSIPTSYLLGRILYNRDIRETGSGNAGATNALRSFGMKVGLIVLVIDVLKGVAAILIGQSFARFTSPGFEANLIVSLSGLAVIIGHIYSIFLGFKGGKGVATATGVFLVLMPFSVLISLVLFIFVVYTSRYVSLGSVLAAFAIFMIELIFQAIMHWPNVPRLFMVLAIVLLIIYRHKANLKRLLEGTEPKFSLRTERQD